MTVEQILDSDLSITEKKKLLTEKQTELKPLKRFVADYVGNNFTNLLDFVVETFELEIKEYLQKELGSILEAK